MGLRKGGYKVAMFDDNRFQKLLLIYSKHSCNQKKQYTKPSLKVPSSNFKKHSELSNIIKNPPKTQLTKLCHIHMHTHEYILTARYYKPAIKKSSSHSIIYFRIEIHYPPPPIYQVQYLNTKC